VEEVPKNTNNKRIEASMGPEVLIHTSIKNAASSVPRENNSESRRRVYPQNPGFGAAGISPAMRSGAFEVEAIAGAKNIVLATVQPNFKFTAHDV